MQTSGVVVDISTGGTADGATPQINFGRSNDVLMSEVHGKFYQQTYRGNMFYGSTATGGVVIPIASSLTPTYSIWNPAGSGKNLVPVVALIGWTATTAALGNLVWQATTNAGSGISSTAPFVAFGTGTPVNALLGAGKASVMRLGSGGTTTLVAAASFYRSTGMSVTATTAATSVAPGWVWRDDFDGTSVIPPGNAIHLFGTTAIAITAQVTMVWYEAPL